jgi:hypothetical protein
MAGLLDFLGGGSVKPLGGTPYGDQSSSFANNLYLLGLNQAQQQFATPTGQQAVTDASANLSKAAQYDTGLLSGDQSTVLSTAAPEISSLLTSYDNSRKAAGELTPRGGGRSEILNELPYKEAGDVNKYIQQVRPQAAKDLTQVATAQDYLGLEQEQLASADVNNSLNFLLGKAGIQLDQAKLAGEQGQALGQSVGAAAQMALMAAVTA